MSEILWGAAERRVRVESGECKSCVKVQRRVAVFLARSFFRPISKNLSNHIVLRAL